MRFLHISDSPLANQIARRSFDTSIHSQGDYLQLLQYSVDVCRGERRKIGVSGKHLHMTTLAGLILMAKNNYSIEFVSIRLNKSDKKSFQVWQKEHGEKLNQNLEELALTGYKVSISFDPERDTFITALTGKKTASHNVSKCFTSRSSDMAEALQLMCYKHFGLANAEDWDKISTEDDSWG